MANETTQAYVKVSPENLKLMHPEIAAVQVPWARINVLMEEKTVGYGSKEFFIPLPNEKPTAIERRKSHFVLGFINPTLDLIRSKGDAIFKKTPERKATNDIAVQFLERADKSGRSLNEIMHEEVSNAMAADGTVFIVVDKPAADVITLADQNAKGVPYIYLVPALSVVNFDWDSQGKLLWFRYKYDRPAPRTNPFGSAAPTVPGYVTWTQTEYMFHDDKGIRLDYIPHDYGMVPVVIQTTILSPNKTIGKSSFFTSSRYIIAGNNMNSISSNEISKSASALLLISRKDLNETAIDRDDDVASGDVKMTQQTADVSDVLPVVDIEKAAPSYLTKDMASVILANESAEKYFKLAIDNENSVKSVSNLSTPQSGVAKAYDLQEVDAMLFNLAHSLESAEKQIAMIVGAEIGMPAGEPAFTVLYPVTFDIRSFSDKMQMLKDLKDVEYPSPTAIMLAQKSMAADITNNPEELEVIYAELATVEVVTEPVEDDSETTDKEPVADTEITND